MSIFELWLLSCVFKVAALSEVALLVAAILALIVVLRIVVLHSEGYHSRGDRVVQGLKAWLKRIVVTLVIGALLYTIAPTKEEAMWIAGGHIATNIDGVGDISENAVKAVNAFLESVAEKED